LAELAKPQELKKLLKKREEKVAEVYTALAGAAKERGKRGGG